MRLTIIALALLISSAAFAQDLEYKTIPLPSNNWSLRADLTISSHGPFAVISADGQVTIDWDLAEKTAANPEKTDFRTLAFARLILAVRNGTWKPMGDKK